MRGVFFMLSRVWEKQHMFTRYIKQYEADGIKDVFTYVIMITEVVVEHIRLSLYSYLNSNIVYPPITTGYFMAGKVKNVDLFNPPN